MTKMTDLEYLRLGRVKRLGYNILLFFLAIPSRLAGLGSFLWRFIKKCGSAIRGEAVDIVTTFVNGDIKTKLSYLVMGFGSIARGQVLRGVLFLLFELLFIAYMVLYGGYWLSKLGTLGTRAPEKVYDEVLDTFVTRYYDDSFKILLYCLLTVFFIVAFVYTWRLNIKQNKLCEGIIASGKRLRSGKDDLRSLVDDQFHKTLLALPLAGILFFTVMPIIFMVLVAFTNYDGAHDGYNNLFTWIGWDNFNQLIGGAGGGNLAYTFGEILSWTLMWAFFATFTNYFLGMFVAIMINKKGIKFKKLWRGILILTIAIPQFVSLLYVSKMFSDTGIINATLLNMGLISESISFWKDPTIARILVVVINIWVGIPYLMLMATGILMNIPKDLYESSRIDGANALQQFTKITFPYMLFVTGPYLLTNFIGNINNFNVIYLLTNGQATANPELLTNGVAATDVDLLITWLFNITNGANSDYKLSAVIGILIFVVVAVISLIVYNLIPSTKNEEDYQ